MGTNNELIVEITRGNMVESCHRGHCVVADQTGRHIHTWGDPTRVIYPRSAIKPLQAIALIETGAADSFQIKETEIALATASHSGTTVHVKMITKWLNRIGLSDSSLECAGHNPMSRKADIDLIRAKINPWAIHNNCSGKHAGFITTALYMNEKIKGYSTSNHPVQRRLLNILSTMGSVNLSSAPRGMDGCGIPVIGMPLEALAVALARMADPKNLDANRAEATKRVISAMISHPNLVAGPGRFDTLTMDQGSGNFVIKTGAEGVYACILPSLGLGVALKIEDGAKRAAEISMAAILNYLNVLKDLPESPIFNPAKEKVGVIRMQANWADCKKHQKSK
jgi:L-asparaginase II